MENVTITYNGIEFNVEGNFYKGTFGSYEYPAESPEFEAISVKILDSDIELLDFFNDLGKISEIENECINQLMEW